MLVARNCAHGNNLERSASMREALMLCQDNGAETSTNGNGDSTGNGHTPRSWPPYIEAIGKCGKFAAFVARNPIEQWPSEGRDKLRGDLQPIAAALWPEKFADVGDTDNQSDSRASKKFTG